MKKSELKLNLLIKRRGLKKKIREVGIVRASPKAIELIEMKLGDYLEGMIDFIKEEMIINGKKSIDEIIVKKGLEKVKKNMDDFEI